MASSKTSGWTLSNLLALLALSFSMSLIIFSHWVYYGCEGSKSSSTFNALKELGQQCPTTTLLPKTPLQTIILEWMPFSTQAAEAAYQMGCRRTFLSGTPAVCESLFALSFLSAIAEWCFYLIVGARLINQFILKPLANGVLRVLTILLVTFIITRAITQYGAKIMPSPYAQLTLVVAQSVENLVIEIFLFFYSSVLFLFYHIRTLGNLESFPGQTLYRTLRDVTGKLAAGVLGNFSEYQY
eukprot:Gregarina_sp_Poly_1__8239@NODE_47_length_17802_cov_82_087454_g41_i0_p4_GENE_NODE_47_length_17802_cov_82_087454_g41_i0NODE_47_length_17802_cov_82_087454_g41_i0_p4_ORF_typecomplete_len241_score21_10_NODE_47_length_17802_cov_82_087454_g41_i01336814090